MYLPAHFELTDADQISDLVASHPLAVMTCQTENGLRADHIPLMMVKNRLVGHIAAANDLHRLLPNGHPVMVVFRGADAYVSANWYPSKAQTHEVVPTWNYEVAHVHGRITFKHDDASKRGAVGQLTKRMEHLTNGDAGWKMRDAPAQFMDQKLAGIVAFDIDIDRIEAKAKFSQNKTDADRLGAADGVASAGGASVAQKMRNG